MVYFTVRMVSLRLLYDWLYCTGFIFFGMIYFNVWVPILPMDVSSMIDLSV